MSQTITLKALTGSQIGAAEQIAALFPGSTVTKTTATFVGKATAISLAISEATRAAKDAKRAAGHNAAAPHWDRLQVKFDEAARIVEIPTDLKLKGTIAAEPAAPINPPKAPAKKVYAPAVKANGKKDWAKAARLYRKYGTVAAVAAEMGCSSTAAARWIRNGLGN